MGEAMELNGITVDRETIRGWLIDKRITLWADWLIGDTSEQDLAIDWVLKQMGQLSEFAQAKPNDGPPKPLYLHSADEPLLAVA